ncbi:hypothetical protein ACLESO_51000 [Pyxidicoccus sp. 3LG]
MMRSRVLVAVLLSTLSACGGDDDDDSNDDDSTKDQRSNVTGDYDITGTLQLSSNGQTSGGDLVDELRIANGSGANTALRLEFGSVGCGPQAKMTGDRAFSVVETSCPMPNQQGCTAAMVFTSGQGSRDAMGKLTMSTSGNINLKCDLGTANVAFVMELNGTRMGQALPGTQEGALTSTGGVTTLGAAVKQWVQDARR